ncbi:hypothetical protein, partial [Dokdonella sp.]|uniref:hypothetical protein n=1 Tax=Dokdonella sp. TaxID=2291710 RepID=UPI003C3B2751
VHPMKTLTTKFRTSLVVLLLGMFMAGAVHAGSIKDGRITVKPAKDDRYQVDGYTFGKAELFGYLSELKETKNITAIILRDGSKSSTKATDEQRNSIASIGTTLQLETFTQQGRDVEPLVKD